MHFRLIFWVCLAASCSADTSSVADGQQDADLGSHDVGIGDVKTDAAFFWPEPKFAEADYLKVAQEICSNPNPDPKNLVFSAVLKSFHSSGSLLFFRNGHTYLHVNEACEMWVLQYRSGDEKLQYPLHKVVEPEELAHILMRFRALEFRTFDEAGQTDFSYTLSPSWRLFYFQGRTYAFDDEYGPQSLGAQPENLNSLEVLVATILKYDPWNDSVVLSGLTPYVGDRLWINVRIPGVEPPDQIFQAWPLSQGLEEFGPNYGCSDNFASFTDMQADLLRSSRVEFLSKPPFDSNSGWAVPFTSSGKKYWVVMSEGLPMENKFGYVTFRDVRIGYMPCN